MRDKLELLIELQKMESAAGKIVARKKDLPAQMEELDAQFAALSATVKTEQEQLENLRKRRREKDSQLQSGQEMLKRTRERLFEVKTNKEYQSMLKEIETLETKNSHLEDEIIVLLDEIDRLEAVMKTKEAELNAGRLRYEEQKVKLEEEFKAIEVELDVCVRKSGEIRKNIPGDLLRKYEQIKAVGRGLAVVSVWMEICDGCHMAIPPQLYNELQKTVDLLTCPNCSRIIYWKNKNDGSA